MEITYFDQKYIDRLLPEREPDTHKGDYGKILLLCGSKGYTGAATLAAMGALRSGAGLVYLGVPESIYAIEAIKLDEPVVFPLPDTEGMFAKEAITAVQSYLDKVDAILIGPGIGLGEGCWELVNYVLASYSGPIVLDADGINLISMHKNVLRGRKGSTILTPHAGEFVRLLGHSINNRMEDARNFATDFNVVVLLKGYNTVITDGKHICVNTTGNPGMAVGGSGDVLAGIIVSLLGQKISPLEAAAAGAWLHGAAGDICANEIGQHGMLPTDVLNALPRLMK